MSVEKTYRIETIVNTENEAALRELVKEFADRVAAHPDLRFYNSTLGIGMARVVSGKPYRRGGYHIKGQINLDG